MNYTFISAGNITFSQNLSIELREKLSDSIIPDTGCVGAHLGPLKANRHDAIIKKKKFSRFEFELKSQVTAPLVYSEPKGKREEHSSTIPSDSRVPEDVLREHSIGVDDHRVLLLCGVEASAVEQRDQILRYIAVTALATFRLLAFFVVAGKKVVHS